MQGQFLRHFCLHVEGELDSKNRIAHKDVLRMYEKWLDLEAPADAAPAEDAASVRTLPSMLLALLQKKLDEKGGYDGVRDAEAVLGKICFKKDGVAVKGFLINLVLLRAVVLGESVEHERIRSVVAWEKSRTKRDDLIDAMVDVGMQDAAAFVEMAMKRLNRVIQYTDASTA